MTLTLSNLIPALLSIGANSAPILVLKYLGFLTAFQETAIVLCGEKTPELTNLPMFTTSSGFTVHT